MEHLDILKAPTEVPLILVMQDGHPTVNRQFANKRVGPIIMVYNGMG
jgi:hypothetical protein